MENEGGLEAATQAPVDDLPTNNTETTSNNAAPAAADQDDWDDIEGVLQTFV